MEMTDVLLTMIAGVSLVGASLMALVIYQIYSGRE